MAHLHAKSQSWKNEEAKKIKRKPTKATNEEEVTEADRQLHQKIAAQVKAKLEAKGKSSEGVETFEAFYGILKEEASKLQKEYQPQLRNGIKIAVDLVNSVKQDEQDGDVDIKVKIAPNNYEEEFKVDTNVFDGPPKGYAYFLRDFIQYKGEYIRHFQVIAHGKKGGILIDLNGYGKNVKVRISPSVKKVKVKAPKNETAPSNMIILKVNDSVYTENDFRPIQRSYQSKDYGSSVNLQGGNIKGGDFLRVDCFALALEVLARKLGAKIPKIDGEHQVLGQSNQDQAKDNENARASNSIIGQGVSPPTIKSTKTIPFSR